VNVAGLDTSDLKEVKALLDVLACKLFAQPARWKARADDQVFETERLSVSKLNLGHPRGIANLAPVGDKLSL
jgi:hypothetical protein